MASEPRRIPVADFIADGDLVINDGYRAKNAELSTAGLPFARAQNINNGFHFEETDRFPEEDLKKVGIKISQPGDVVFTSKGTVGRFALVRPETPRFVYAPQLCFWRSLNTNRIDPLWLYHWMHSREFYVQFKGVSGQTDMAEYVSLRDQRAMHLTLPDITAQRRIAHILGTLDDKIELNRRMNRTLERIAAAIFKSWFIDFDPVRAKADGRPPLSACEHAQAGNLPAQIALPAPQSAAARQAGDLFPNSFEDSELGPIPKGWGVENLPEVIEVNPRRSLSRGTVAPYVAMKEMPTQLSRPAGWRRREFNSGSKFRNGDVLLARITPCLENGKTAFVDFLGGDEIGWGSTEYIVLHSKPPLPIEFTYCLARSERLRKHAISNMTGTSGRQRVPTACFDRFPVVVPSEDVASAFGHFVQPAFRKTKANDFQSNKLERLRDTLLPKLLSGEIAVAAAAGRAER